MVEIGNGLEMRAMSAGLQEMIKIGSDCAQFSHLPPTRRLRLLDHYECTGSAQREQNTVSKRQTGCEKEENLKSGGEGRRVDTAHVYTFVRHNKH